MSAPELSPEDARERFLAKRETDATDRTIRSYRNRLDTFVEWCESEDIEHVGDLTPFHIDEFDLSIRQRDYAPTTIKGHLATLKVYLDYLASIGAVDDPVAEAVDVPTLSRGEESSDTRLAPEDALAAIQAFRNDPAMYATPKHALLEVAWHTGARMGGLRALDLDDYHPEEGYVEFRHRESTGTPLKNKEDGERLVGIPDAVCDVVDTYIARERYDKRDEFGRDPLFSARQARPSFTTIRAWAYLASQPCLWRSCPHDEDPAMCEYRNRGEASRCPSSRSPHQIRTGSVTWQLNRGLDVETVAARVNAAPGTIRRFYDKATDFEEFSERRSSVSTALDISEDGNE